MNLIIFIGAMIYYYGYDETIRKFFKNGEGIIDIIMIVISCVTFSFLIFFYKTDAFKN